MSSQVLMDPDLRFRKNILAFSFSKKGENLSLIKFMLHFLSVQLTML